MFINISYKMKLETLKMSFKLLKKKKMNNYLSSVEGKSF